jgi:hypothetical protein
MKTKSIVILIVLLGMSAGCVEKKSYQFVKQTIPKGASIAVIIDAKNEIKNSIIGKFMDKGYKVKAVNASDLFTLSDAFTVKDYKHLAYEESEVVLSSPDDTLTTAQKSFDSIYKLHIYNYESQKADLLAEMKNKWGIKYLVILELKDWENVSWARAIDLESYEVIAIENYPNKYSDKVDGVVSHFIETFTAKN